MRWLGIQVDVGRQQILPVVLMDNVTADGVHLNGARQSVSSQRQILSRTREPR